jgi:kynurenine formamidase
MTTRPRFADLPFSPDTPPNSSWGLYGPDDALGTLNLLTPERVLAAASCIRTGKRFTVGLPLDLPSPPFFGRQPLEHTVISLMPGMMDDKLDNYWPQGSTQWDAICHFGTEGTFYNGNSEADVRAGRLGIHAAAREGIVGRGVLLDVARHAAATGSPIDPDSSFEIMPDLLDATAAAQGIDLREGDILCLRTGWVGWYLGLDAEGRARPAAASLTHVDLRCPGLSYRAGMAEYLWDHGVAAVAADNPTVEVMPPPPSPTGDPALTDPNATLHAQVMGKLGMTLGEFFDFDDLADDCAADGIYEFFFAAAPINVTGGVGSPPSAVIVK